MTHTNMLSNNGVGQRDTREPVQESVARGAELVEWAPQATTGASLWQDVTPG